MATPLQTGMEPGTLTSAAFIRRLESLFLLVRRVLGGSLQADRKSQRKGAGIMFTDYAEYHYGDDYRAIDWRVFARNDQLVIKLFELEEDATLYLLLDLSPSMQAKLAAAKKLAAALGYIALNCQDRIAVYGLADDLRPILDISRGRGKIFPLLNSLENATCFGKDTDFATCTRNLQARHRKKGLVVVISDFLFPTGYAEGLKRLSGLGHDVHAIQVLADDDLTCDWKGDVEIECVESGQRDKITITAREADAYAAAVKAWNDGLQAECAKRSIGFTRTMENEAFENIIQTILRKGGLAT
jgi:uncharacterized protein (DUF58 family)